MSGAPAMLAVAALGVAYEGDAGPVRAVDGVSFDVASGEFFTLLGPSGCGKTTTLRSVAGFETPRTGRIAIGGAAVFDARARLDVPVHRRDIAMVFQSYAIWPHMTVAQNVAFPLEAAGLGAAAARGKVRAALDLVGLGGLLDRPATQLSGGQQQRVALARAIAKDAKLLLLDEPLSNLDAQLREQMRAELAALQARLGTTTLYVTHDQEEALSLSGRIALMQDGRIVECGTPHQLYYRPRRLFTARFIGRAELIAGRIAERRGAEVAVETAFGRLLCAEAGPGAGGAATVMLRPEHAGIAPPGADLPNTFEGVVQGAVFQGRVVEYDVAVGAARLKVQALSTRPHTAGERVRLHLPPDRCVLIEEREP